jgi:hypothetical protein
MRPPLPPDPVPHGSRWQDRAPRERHLGPRAAVLCGLTGIVLAIAVIGIGSHVPAGASAGRQSVQTAAPSPSKVPTPAPGLRWPWS